HDQDAAHPYAPFPVAVDGEESLTHTRRKANTASLDAARQGDASTSICRSERSWFQPLTTTAAPVLPLPPCYRRPPCLLFTRRSVELITPRFSGEVWDG